MSKHIAGFGEELSKLEFKGSLDWLIKIDSLEDFTYHKTYAITQLTFLVGAVIIWIHAIKKGGRWPYLVLASILHGFTVELISYFATDIDSFWHAQSSVIFIGRRLPLYITILYPVFYYHASWAVSKMNLTSSIARYLAVGLLVVLIDMPYDIIGVKFLHWVWHDTDPNIAERHYWVPWNSYYFHACFAASFSFFFHNTRKWLEKRNIDTWKSGSIFSELSAVLAAALFGMPGGCLLFLPFYHPLHDFLKIPTEVTSISLLLIFGLIIWRNDRNSDRKSKSGEFRLNGLSILLLAQLVFHYISYVFIAVYFNPEDVVSVGLHEPIGECGVKSPVQTILKTLEKSKYLCASHYDEKYFDFHCLPGGKAPKDGSIWYTICGTPFENRAEYIWLMSLLALIAFVVFYSIHTNYDNSSKKSDKNSLENVKTDKKVIKTDKKKKQ